MKRAMIFFVIIFSFVSITACDFLTTSSTNADNLETTDETSITTETTSEIPITETITTTVETTTDFPTQSTTSGLPTTSTTQTTTSGLPTTSTTSTTTTSTTTEPPITSSETTTTVTPIGQPYIPENYSLLQDELDYIGIPSTGDVKVLVFAVDFSDSPANNPTSILADLELAFNGNSSELVFESLNSYYLESSFQKLNITADIFGFYRASETSSYYENENDRLYETDPITGESVYNDTTYVESDLIFELLTYYDDIIDYSEYDSNQDGFIDGIYIVYNHPVSFNSGSDLWWAYQYYYMYQDTFDGVSPDYYVWSGVDFLYEGTDPVNARTLIHETGHMLGLEDYYDYYPDDLYNSGGLGTYMMDYAIGDHDPFSKILLGWITPKVIESSMTVEILPHLENGDVLLVIDQWNNTIFDEYFLITYYTPTGLNYLDQDYMFTTPGIVIFHISAVIDNGYNQDSYYYSIFNNNNTDSLNKLIKIVEADMGGDIDIYQIVENSDLFLIGDKFGLDIYDDYRWYDNTPTNLFINIIAIEQDKATIEIVFN